MLDLECQLMTKLAPLKTVVVMPAFNEQDSITKVIEEVKKYLPQATLLVVDDGSIDFTLKFAKAAGAIVAPLPFNLGVGGAMRLGYKYAREHGFECLVQIDADGQHDPRDVSLLVEKIKDFDLVLGSRFAGKGNYRVSGPRNWAMMFLSWALSKICNTKLTDTTSGFKASGRKAIEIFAENFPAEYLGDTVEALVIASKTGLKISEVPVNMRERSGGKPSNSSFQSAVHLARACSAIFFSIMSPKKNLRIRGQFE